MKQSAIEKLGLMIDCSRNSVMSVHALKKLIPILSKMGYTTLQLYTEDTYEVNNEPYFGYMRGRYSKQEIKEIDAYAASYNIELIPCIQTLAHLRALFRWPEYQKINDTEDILLVGEERVYTLLENIFDTLKECFSSRRVNIGMDEAHALGQGKYAEKYGHVERSEIMLKHLERVNQIANSRGFTCSMWSDMFFYMVFGEKNYTQEEVKIPEDLLERIPKNINLIYWDYYNTEKEVYDNNIRSHLRISNNIIFAGGAWTWVGFTPLNHYAIEANRAALKSCIENGIKEAFVTAWGNSGGYCSPFSVLPALMQFAENSKGNFDQDSIKKKFKEIVGVDYDAYIALDLPNILSFDQDLKKRYNPSKYLLYNDVLVGVYDSTIKIGGGEIYSQHSNKLKELETDREYGYIFKTARKLCDCLYLKADLGRRTRVAYQQKDIFGLKELIEKCYTPLIGELKKLYQLFTAYWEKLYKPYSFETINIRFGGLIYRIQYVKKRLTAYINGKVKSVPELEEILLDKNGGGTVYENKPILDSSWGAIVTLNIL